MVDHRLSDAISRYAERMKVGFALTPGDLNIWASQVADLEEKADRLRVIEEAASACAGFLPSDRVS